MGTFLSGYTGSRALWNFPFDKWPRVSRSTKQQYIYLFRGNKFCIMPYKAPPIRLDEIPKKENTKPELACKENDILWEHLKWPNTVFARALADAIQRAHQVANTNKSLIQLSIYLLNGRSIFASFLRNWTQCVDSFSLYNKGMLENVMTQKNTAAILGFVFIIERTQVNTAHAQLQKIETHGFCRNLPISNHPVIRISRNLVGSQS